MWKTIRTDLAEMEHLQKQVDELEGRKTELTDELASLKEVCILGSQFMLAHQNDLCACVCMRARLCRACDEA